MPYMISDAGSRSMHLAMGVVKDDEFLHCFFYPAFQF
jgi:hypothetical protein